MPRPVTLAAPDPSWPLRAEALIAALRAAAPGAFVALHPIGSTAVPGLIAKPVIDLLGETADLTAIEAASAALEGRAGVRAARTASPDGAISPATIRRRARGRRICTSMRRATR